MENLKTSKKIGTRNLNLSDSEILKKLKSLGRLDTNFEDKDLLLIYSVSTNKDIRYLAINNLAKLNDESLLYNFSELLNSESTSRNRREIASAIGRLRSEKAIPFMKKMLKDSDPNVVLQSIRGLLVFKGDKKIEKILLQLKEHENELVRKVIDIEFFDDSEYTNNHAESPDYLKNCIVN
jgi:hypothetical protein